MKHVQALGQLSVSGQPRNLTPDFVGHSCLITVIRVLLYSNDGMLLMLANL